MLVVTELNPYTAKHNDKEKAWKAVAEELHKRTKVVFAYKTLQSKMSKLLEAHESADKAQIKESGTVQEKDEEGKTISDYLDDILSVRIRSLCLFLVSHSQ